MISGESEIKKRACVKFAAGCPRSRLDAIHLNDYLVERDFILVDGIVDAELILVGLCGFDNRSERISKNALKIIMRQKRNDALVIPFGCLSEINPQIFGGRPDIFPVDYHRIDKINEIVPGPKKFDEIDASSAISHNFNFDRHDFRLLDRIRFEVGLFFNDPFKYIVNVCMDIGPKALRPIANPDYYIRIAKGCTGFCSYCAIKSAAGRLTSYPIEKILICFESGLSKGFGVFRLLGEDVGGYGKDIKSNIVILLDELFRRKGNFKLVLEDFSPKWLIRYLDSLLKVFKDNAHRIHHVVIPIQSGSEKIVKQMRRGYRVDRAVEALTALKRTVPGLKISSHVVVGFPGETELDFQATIDVLSLLKFDHIEAHFYSDRPGCASNEFSDKIPDLIIVWRLWRLRRKFAETCRVRI